MMPGKVLFQKTGRLGTVTVIGAEAGLKQLRINDVPEVPTDPGSLMAFHLLGHLPCLFHPRPRRGLVLCFGAGITTSAMALHPLERIDAVEVCAEVIEAAACFSEENRNILADPRLRLIRDESRHSLEHCRGRYDVVACDSTHPRSADSSMLYTREFYGVVRTRLEPGGVFSQWLPLHGLRADEFRRILRTFLDAFPQGSLWFADRFVVLLGPADPLAVDFTLLLRRLSLPPVHEDLAAFHLHDPYALLSCCLAGPGALARYTARARPVTDRRGLSLRTTRARLALDTKPANVAELLTIQESLGAVIPNLPNTRESRNRMAAHVAARRHILEGRIHCFQGDYGKERACYQKALRTVPAHGEAKRLLREAEYNLLLVRAGKHTQARSYATALALYRRAARIEPLRSAPQYNLGVVHIKRGEPAKALAAFRRGLTRAPWDGRIHYGLGLAYFELGRPDASRRALEEALRLDPTLERAARALQYMDTD